MYEDVVLPNLKSDCSVLDFGCGKGDYIKKLPNDISVGVEFYPNNKTRIFDNLGNQMIDELVDSLRDNGLFDVVICDSVMNSVNSLEARDSVLSCLNAFLKIGGTLYISGLTQEPLKVMKGKDRTSNTKTLIKFPDINGFTADYRKGNWYFQYYQTEHSVREMLANHGFEIIDIGYKKYHSIGYHTVAVKVSELPEKVIEKAIDFEFNLPLPDGKSYQRQEDVKMVLKI